MNIIDQFNIQRYHKEQMAAYGEDNARALGWKTEEGQFKRFEILSQIGDLENCSVLDAGCGYGDLCGFLNQRFTGMRYIGIDLEDVFLERATQRYSNSGETAFFTGDVTKAELPFTDYILASGIFNYPNSDTEYLFKTIVKLFNNCRIGFGFNLLDKTEATNSLLVTYDRHRVLAFCKTLSNSVVLKENYYENDFTIMMYTR